MVPLTAPDRRTSHSSICGMALKSVDVDDDVRVGTMDCVLGVVREFTALLLEADCGTKA